MPELGVVADDVTGAADLAGLLVRDGLRTVLALGPARDEELPDPEAVVVALKSRTAPRADAVAWSLDALSWLRELEARRVFLKVCSTFDSTPEGNIGPVADALLDALGGDVALVCPAYPANGRTVYQGHLFVGDRLVSETSMASHPLTPMTDPDLVRWLGRQTRRRVALVPLEVVRDGLEERLEALRAAGFAYAVADAVADADVRALGAAARSLPLAVGGAALGAALVEPRPPATQELPAVGGPAAVLAGSCSDATLGQVRVFAERYPALRVGGSDSADEVAARVQAAERPVLVYSSAPPEERSDDGAAIERLFGELARQLVARGARRLVVAGGETSGAVAQALGLRALAVGAEIAPGVPRLVSLGRPPLALAFKSGNFGGPEFFLEALEALR
jgi:uncharacterized protein YgbK (DUF1537 family)